MKHTLFFLLLIPLIGCQNPQRHQCQIEYIDSLEIKLEDGKLRVAVLDLAQDSSLRPYAMFYDNHLIVLNKADAFYAFKQEGYQRDTVYEMRLNTKPFKKAFVLYDTLYAVDRDRQAYRFDSTSDTWIKTSYDLPFFNRIPMYEDDRYICYSLCYGEFGGIVFFYNKANKRITYVTATCAAGIMEAQNDEYYLFSNLAHLDHNSDICKILDPDALEVFPQELREDDENWRNIYNYNRNRAHYVDAETGELKRRKNEGVEEIAEISEKLITGGFIIRDIPYFITQEYVLMNENPDKVSFKEVSRLTRLEGDSLININIHDLILAELSGSHGEITRKVKGNTVIDYTWFGDEQEDWKETDPRSSLHTSFIISDSTLIRINW